MRRGVRFLLYASRVLAICAVLAGLAAGFLATTLIAGLACFDNCPPPDSYFSHLGPGSLWLMTPCVALESLALVTFLVYCAATGQPRRAVTPLLFLVIGGLAGVAALYALMLHGQASLPIAPPYTLAEGPLEAWAHQWGLALTAVAGVWSGVLAYLQWPAA